MTQPCNAQPPKTTKLTIRCWVCGKDFQRYPSRVKATLNHCSPACHKKGHTMLVDCACIVCGRPFQNYPADMKRIVTCSTRCRHAARGTGP